LLDEAIGYALARAARLVPPRCALPGPARALHAWPPRSAWRLSVVARGAGRYWPLGLGRLAELRWLRTRRRRGIASCRSPRQWPVTGKFHGDSDRQALAASGLQVRGSD